MINIKVICECGCTIFDNDVELAEKIEIKADNCSGCRQEAFEQGLEQGLELGFEEAESRVEFEAEKKADAEHQENNIKALQQMQEQEKPV